MWQTAEDGISDGQHERREIYIQSNIPHSELQSSCASLRVQDYSQSKVEAPFTPTIEENTYRAWESPHCCEWRWFNLTLFYVNMRYLASMVLKCIIACMGVEEKVMRDEMGNQSSLIDFIRKQLRQMLGTNRL